MAIAASPGAANSAAAVSNRRWTGARKTNRGYPEANGPPSPSSYAMTSDHSGIDTPTAWVSSVGRLTPKGSPPAPWPATRSALTLLLLVLLPMAIKSASPSPSRAQTIPPVLTSRLRDGQRTCEARHEISCILDATRYARGQRASERHA